MNCTGGWVGDIGKQQQRNSISGVFIWAIAFGGRIRVAGPLILDRLANRGLATSCLIIRRFALGYFVLGSLGDDNFINERFLARWLAIRWPARLCLFVS